MLKVTKQTHGARSRSTNCAMNAWQFHSESRIIPNCKRQQFNSQRPRRSWPGPGARLIYQHPTIWQRSSVLQRSVTDQVERPQEHDAGTLAEIHRVSTAPATIVKILVVAADSWVRGACPLSQSKVATVLVLMPGPSPLLCNGSVSTSRDSPEPDSATMLGANILVQDHVLGTSAQVPEVLVFEQLEPDVNAPERHGRCA